MQATPRSLNTLWTSAHQIVAHGLTPNTSIQHRPLQISHSVFPSNTSASQIESHLRSIGVVEPQWRYTMYSTSHFHATTHEVLVVTRGKAKLCFGCEENPGRVEPVVSRGDVMIVPAGVAHRLLEDLDGAFEMVGNYPTGKSWDMCYGKESEKEKVIEIGKLAWFEKDPIYGDERPVLDAQA